MDLHEIAAQICSQMGAITAKEKKCGIRFNTTMSKEQYISFFAFWVLSNKSREEIKSIDFYEFDNSDQREEKLKKIVMYLQGQINEDQLFNN